MVKIRLKRMGTAKRPVYRLVVADSRSPRDGRFIEAIGFYDPLPNPAVVSIDEEKVRTWMRKGARPSDSARYLLVQQGILAAQPRPARPAAPAPAATGGSESADTTPVPSAAPAAETAAPAEAQLDGADVDGADAVTTAAQDEATEEETA